MIAILTAAYEMGGSTGWTVLALLAGVPALTLILALWLLTPPFRRPGPVPR